MHKNSYNRKRIKESSKKPFRLEDDILLSASNRHSDSYRIVTVARPLRENYNVHLVMSHEPSQKIVYSKTWLFSNMENCWDKFHVIVDITKGVRDFVETEGIQTVTAQYMLKHNLSAISADIQNMYETNIPYWRSIEDPSTRGNLLKNFPTIPNYVHSGPENLSSVFKSTGNFTNPVPKNDIRPPYVHQHTRHEKGMKDIVPLSGFQAAVLGAGYNICKAGSNKQIKTAESLPVNDFLNSVKDNSSNAVKKGKEFAVSHYIKMTGSSEEDGSKFYDTVKDLFSDQKVVMELSPDDLVRFFSEGVYSPDIYSKAFNSKKSKQLSQALRLGFMPVKATLRCRPGGSSGKFSISAPVGFCEMVIFSGNMERLRDPTREDYVNDPMDCLYSIDDATDCRSSSAILSMNKSDLSGGPGAAVRKLSEKDCEYGMNEVLLFDTLKTDDVSEITVNNEEDAGKARRILDNMGKILPVITKDSISLIESSKGEGFSYKLKQESKQNHFASGDEVRMKPSLNNPSINGKISDVTSGMVTVQWDNGDRHIYDMAEALMRIMTIPGGPEPIDGMVVYSLPGMDDETVSTLSSLHIDPVTVHSIVSHAQPAAESIGGWEKVLKDSFLDLGIEINNTAGYIFSDEEDSDAFVPHQWFEGKLQDGARLIVDLSHNKFEIKAGYVDDYIKLVNPINFE